MSESIEPTNWGRQADRLVTAGIILGAATLGWHGGKDTAPTPIIQVVPSKVVNNIQPAKTVTQVTVPPDSIRVTSTSNLMMKTPLRVEIQNFDALTAALKKKLERKAEAVPAIPAAKAKEKVQAKEKAKVKVEAPKEGSTFPVAK